MKSAWMTSQTLADVILRAVGLHWWAEPTEDIDA